MSAPYTDFDTGKLCLTFFNPLYQDGSLKAVAAADVFIDALVKTVLSVKLRGDGYVFLVDKAGNVIAHPNQQLTLKPLTNSAPELTAERLNAAADSGEVQEVQMAGNSMYLQMVPIVGTDWLLGTAINTEVVSGPMAKVLWSIVAIVVVALIILVPIASLLLASM